MARSAETVNPELPGKTGRNPTPCAARRAAPLDGFVNWRTAECHLKSWIYRLAFQGKHAEDALVHAPQRFPPHESLMSTNWLVEILSPFREPEKGEHTSGSHE